jgi:hypothetical protein
MQITDAIPLRTALSLSATLRAPLPVYVSHLQALLYFSGTSKVASLAGPTPTHRTAKKKKQKKKKNKSVNQRSPSHEKKKKMPLTSESAQLLDSPNVRPRLLGQLLPFPARRDVGLPSRDGLVDNVHAAQHAQVRYFFFQRGNEDE